MRKVILTILGLLFVVGAVFGARYLINSKNRVRPVPPKIVKTVFTDIVKNTSIPIVIAANGNLTAKRRVELYAEVQGVFKAGSKLFKPGQEYGSGQTLIHIDASEYYATVQSAKSNLYNSLTAIMPDLRLDFPEIYSKWQQYLNNFDINGTTPELPKMVSEKENYFISGRGIVSSYYNIKNLEQRLSKYSIRAPFRGILTEALVTEGTLVRSGQKLGEYIDPSVYEMEVAISKSYADLLEKGKRVTLNNIEGTQTYEGIVSRVNASIDVATQTVTAFIEVKNKTLKEGMYLEAQLEAKQEQDAIEINRNLLLENNEVYVVKNDSILDVVSVKPVYFSDAKVVLKNVPEGTVIVTRPLQGAFAGMLVKKFEEKKATKSN
ncbi:HlyD family efflux transporter periplasmic adaptor subunit [Flavobacteriaceae bacterium AU392]|nr:HlyD family efflux transporter periplasmic adaptor subunit [Flavobacteriaceae bacterium]RKM81478.1 HlyD family efflux transporter periplasmic adaptor subunit [Flavobacteriaceae bacterium AU392]